MRACVRFVSAYLLDNACNVKEMLGLSLKQDGQFETGKVMFVMSLFLFGA